MSAITQRHHPQREAILTALAAEVVDAPNGEMYIDLVMAVLPQAARHFLEGLMSTGTYEYKSEFARRYYSRGKAEGEAEGEVKALLRVLERRGFVISEKLGSRIAECRDLDQIDVWIDRAVTASRIEEIFAD
ncbi:hypothetical protein ACIP5Y_16405 [Nocardia sp. NPDC088792]|uniref:hypothetical protein n=1 Tax=Nocardia sp. NPDC088792 TaxID=3364332 RepID=UPI0038221577